MRPQPPPALRVLHLLVLFAFALARPLFELLERNPEFLIAHRADTLDLWLLAAMLVLGVPLATAAVIEGVCRLNASAGRAVHLVAVALLVTALFVPPFDRALESREAVAVMGAGLAGIAFTVAYAFMAPIRSFLTVLSPAILLFPLLFLSSSSIAGLGKSGVANGAVSAQVENPAPVVFVIFDALPLTSLLDTTGAIDARRTPHLAALAREGHWFRNATTVATFTDYAVPALLTGRYARWQRQPTAAEYPQNLFTLLGESHVLNVFEPNTRLCPTALCGDGPLAATRGVRLAAIASDLVIVAQHLVRPGRFGISLPAVDNTWRDFAGSAGVGGTAWRQRVRKHRYDPDWLFRRFLEGVRESRRPGLHFLHLPVPHSPYRYLPSGRNYRHSPRAFDALVRVRGRRELVDEWAVTQLLQAHLLQVGYADRLLGELVDHLKREGLYDRALLVVASDHGVALRPGVPRRELARNNGNAAEILPVPLIIRIPGQHEGSVSDRNVETIDVLPTILGALGTRAPEPLDGHSLLRRNDVPRTIKLVALKTVTSETGVAARDGEPRRKLRIERFGAKIPGGAAVVADIYARFRLETGPDALFSVGPNRDLLGRTLDELPLAVSPVVALELRNADDYEHVDPASDFVPANVAGTLRDATIGDAPLELVVALDRRIFAVTQTLALVDGAAPFTALLPDGAFQPGANPIEVFVVRRGEAGRFLEPTASGARSPAVHDGR
jgi:hypothetical protein